jgi:UDP-3-O-[3-hydroxymyristoyl] glucosamine N-acyltransferase
MKQITLALLATLTESSLVGDPEHSIQSVASLDEATLLDASFLSDSFLSKGRYTEALKKTKAGVIFVSPDTDTLPGKNYLITKTPSKAFQTIIKLLAKDQKYTGFDSNLNTTIHKTAKIDTSSSIGPNATIDENVSIGKNTYIGASVFIGPNSSIGDNCTIHPGVVIRENTIIEDRVIIQPNAVIGSCGFGYDTDENGQHNKIDQVGNVIVEEDVEIGANTAIDRARFSSTVIKKGTKIDNLIQIAHNCEIGPYNLLAAQTGVAGSTKTGSHVFCGGQVGILGHVEIEGKTMIATRSGVSKSLKSGTYRGSPAIPIDKYNRQKVYERKIESFIKKVQQLEDKIKLLEENNN